METTTDGDFVHFKIISILFIYEGEGEREEGERGGERVLRMQKRDLISWSWR